MRYLLPICISLSIAFACSQKQGGENVKTIYFEGTEKVRQLITYKNGLRNGIMKEFYPNGNLKARQYYLNDTVTDTLFFYHENGRLAEYQVVRDKMKVGCWRKYNKEGAMYSEINFKDGVLHGPSKVYAYKTGRLIESYNFEKGLKHGWQKEFYSNGKPKYVAYYYQGQPGSGTLEWTDRGEVLNNDFKVSVTEQNRVLMDNTLNIIVKPEPMLPGDDVYEVSPNDTGNVLTTLYHLSKDNDHFTRPFSVAKGGFIMQKLKFAVYRKTPMGNTFVKTVSLNVSVNHF